MKAFKWYLAIVLAVTGFALLYPLRAARAGDDGYGFGYGESHPCQVCTQAQMADHNQLALRGRG